MSTLPVATEPFLAGGARVENAAERVFTIVPRPGEDIAAVFRRLAATLAEDNASMLKLMIFGPIAAHAEAGWAMREHFCEIAWPVTWVEGGGCHRAPIAGMQAFALSGGRTKRVVWRGRVVGSVYEDGGARHCLLGGLGPRDVNLGRPAQARQTFETLAMALARAGFGIGDVARTWFFNDDILAWYADFNHVRTAFFANRHFRAGSPPASTGIAGRNPSGAALSAGAWAVQPLDRSARVEEVVSPLQCPAPAYGSSFSRAVEIFSGGRRRLLVSGTASIAPDGRTLWPDDVRKQIERTMEVVAAILCSRRMDFGDVTRATAYFKRPADAPVFDAWRAAHGLHAMPVVPVQADICREDLLFEFEADACSEEWRA